jgi:hypothetical protein
MGMEVHLILAIDVDDEMDNQDDEDHEEFLFIRKIKRLFNKNNSFLFFYYKMIFEHFFDQFDLHFHKKVVHE